MKNRTVAVPGISCAHCVATIERELGKLDGVAAVRGHLGSKSVSVEWDSPATWEAIAARLAEIGYPPAG